MTLPTTPQSREQLGITPLNATVMLAGMPKVGKSTLAAGWAPKTTLIVDTQQGTTLLDGEHFVSHVTTWLQFEAVVNELRKGDHPYQTVVLDMVDDLWNFVDLHLAGTKAVLATSTNDYTRSAKAAEGTFRNVIGGLLATGMGVWFLTHTKAVQDGDLTRYVSRLDNRVVAYVQGAAQFVLLAEAMGPRRVLHTQPSARFEAGGRLPLPEPMDLDARKLYAAMARALKAKPTAKPAEPDNGAESTPEPTEVAA